VREAEADRYAALALKKHCSEAMLKKIREGAWRGR
jgi:hypothetical protein